MASYYVDFENVGSLGMDGTSLLTAADTVYIFYSNKADTMKMDVVAQIYNTPAKIVFEKVELGTPNALDFQLLTDLFCTIQNSQGESYIISKDTGYDVAVKRGRAMYNFKLWRKKSIRLAIEASIRNDNESKNSLPKEEALASVETEPSEAEAKTENQDVEAVVEVLHEAEEQIQTAAEESPDLTAVLTVVEEMAAVEDQISETEDKTDESRQISSTGLDFDNNESTQKTDERDAADDLTADIVEASGMQTAEALMVAEGAELEAAESVEADSRSDGSAAKKTETAVYEMVDKSDDKDEITESKEPEAQTNEASETEPAIVAEVHEKTKRSRNRSRRRNSQRKRENQNVEEVLSETDDTAITEAVETESEVKAENEQEESFTESKALITSPLPAELIVIDQKPPIKLSKRSGNKRNDNRKNHEKAVMASLPEEIRYLLKSQCDMDITDEECDIVIKAVGSSNNKGEFYHCFRREMGDAKGREFYLRIRSCFDSIRKLAKKYE